MSGLTHDSASPQDVILHAVSRQLEISFDDGARFRLPAEYLRVHSPSAEVRGHGVGNEVLQTGKLHVAITGLEPVGHYALKIVFDDGHDSGLYSWAYLYELGVKHDQYWQDYLNRLAAAGASRE
ncbi:gamma-butyrobetaine hydroxylase-like domain-containing protein [Vogesella mureinivorans]|uniref:gamma-butyrobetaine hydroxylase-like domain-containing protein n=1 Tax=Vogesella mureinivorans TaxID=657276 RepID=UPI00037FAD9B|nr:DUF971 domain-containing protein [Vogesella mureinivorans]